MNKESPLDHVDPALSVIPKQRVRYQKRNRVRGDTTALAEAQAIAVADREALQAQSKQESRLVQSPAQNERFAALLATFFSQKKRGPVSKGSVTDVVRAELARMYKSAERGDWVMNSSNRAVIQRDSSFLRAPSNAPDDKGADKGPRAPLPNVSNDRGKGKAGEFEKIKPEPSDETDALSRQLDDLGDLKFETREDDEDVD